MSNRLCIFAHLSMAAGTSVLIAAIVNVHTLGFNLSILLYLKDCKLCSDRIHGIVVLNETNVQKTALIFPCELLCTP